MVSVMLGISALIYWQLKKRKFDVFWSSKALRQQNNFNPDLSLTYRGCPKSLPDFILITIVSLNKFYCVINENYKHS